MRGDCTDLIRYLTSLRRLTFTIEYPRTVSTVGSLRAVLDNIGQELRELDVDVRTLARDDLNRTLPDVHGHPREFVDWFDQEHVGWFCVRVRSLLGLARVRLLWNIGVADKDLRGPEGKVGLADGNRKEQLRSFIQQQCPAIEVL